MKIRSVNLEKLISFEPPGAFMQIAPEVEKDIAVYPELNERIKACVSFCYQLENKPQYDRDISERRKYLRAALAELVSLEDVSELDSPNNKKLKILSLDDARLHVVRLLRHANVHLAASDINEASRPAIWNGPNGPERFDYEIIYIPDIKQSISSTDQANNYTPADLTKMMDWIDKEQKEWGIGHLVLRSAELYAKEFLNKCT